jgi:hypothetical protein
MSEFTQEELYARFLKMDVNPIFFAITVSWDDIYPGLTFLQKINAGRIIVQHLKVAGISTYGQLVEVDGGRSTSSLVMLMKEHLSLTDKGQLTITCGDELLVFNEYFDRILIHPLTPDGEPRDMSDTYDKEGRLIRTIKLGGYGLEATDFSYFKLANMPDQVKLVIESEFTPNAPEGMQWKELSRKRFDLESHKGGVHLVKKRGNGETVNVLVSDRLGHGIVESTFSDEVWALGIQMNTDKYIPMYNLYRKDTVMNPLLHRTYREEVEIPSSICEDLHIGTNMHHPDCFVIINTRDSILAPVLWVLPNTEKEDEFDSNVD